MTSSSNATAAPPPSSPPTVNRSRWVGLMAGADVAQSAIHRLQSDTHQRVLDGESYGRRQRPTISTDPLTAHRPRREHHAADADTPARCSGSFANGPSHLAGELQRPPRRHSREGGRCDACSRSDTRRVVTPMALDLRMTSPERCRHPPSAGGTRASGMPRAAREIGSDEDRGGQHLRLESRLAGT